MHTNKSILSKILFPIFILLQTSVSYAESPQNLLIQAIQRSDVRDVEKILNEYKEKIDFKKINENTEKKDTILTLASRLGNTKIVEEILKHSPYRSDEQVKREDTTPLYIAAQEGHTEVAKLLIEKGSDLNKASNDGVTPLYIAAEKGHTEVVKLLIEKGADLNKVRNDGITPFFIAVQQGQTGIAKLLIEKGADLNKARNDGITPLYIAAQQGHTGIAKLLIEKGVDLNMASNNQATPLYIAAQEGHTEVAKLLIEKGADLNIASNGGWTPLAISFHKKHSNITKEILSAKGLDLANEYQLAIEKNNHELSSTLNQAVKERRELKTKQRKDIEELKRKVVTYFSESDYPETQLKNEIFLTQSKTEDMPKSQTEELQKIQDKLKELETKLEQLQGEKRKRLQELLAEAKDKEKSHSPQEVAELRFQFGAMLLSKNDVDYKKAGEDLLREVMDNNIDPYSLEATKLLALEKVHDKLLAEINPKETLAQKEKRFLKILNLIEVAGDLPLYDSAVRGYVSKANPHTSAHPLHESGFIEPGNKGTVALLKALIRMSDPKRSPSYVNDNRIKPSGASPHVKAMGPNGEEQNSNAGSAEK